MKPVAAVVLLPIFLSVSACVIGPWPEDKSSGDAGATGQADAALSSTGTGCGTDALTGVALCATTSACPGVFVDREIYPHCGFKVPNSSIELQCICGDYLCSAGTVLDCKQAQTLLASQTEISVCSQLSYDRCALRGTSRPSTTTNTCDRTCLSGCTGAPGCATLCGC